MQNVCPVAGAHALLNMLLWEATTNNYELSYCNYRASPSFPPHGKKPWLLRLVGWSQRDKTFFWDNATTSWNNICSIFASNMAVGKKVPDSCGVGLIFFRKFILQHWHLSWWHSWSAYSPSKCIGIIKTGKGAISAQAVEFLLSSC